MNNNLDPEIWGGAMWDSMKYIAYGYPDYPTEKEKKYYYKYFYNLKYLLPCTICKFHYDIIINNGPYKLTKDVVKNRTNLTKWLYDVHNYINSKLGKTFDKTYQEITDEIDFDRPDQCNI